MAENKWVTRGYNLYKWSYGPLPITRVGAHSVQPLWTAWSFVTLQDPDLPVPYILGTKLPVANTSGN